MTEDLSPAEKLRRYASVLRAWADIESGPPFDYARIPRSSLDDIANAIERLSRVLEWNGLCIACAPHPNHDAQHMGVCTRPKCDCGDGGG